MRNFHPLFLHILSVPFSPSSGIPIIHMLDLVFHKSQGTLSFFFIHSSDCITSVNWFSSSLTFFFFFCLAQLFPAMNISPRLFYFFFFPQISVWFFFIISNLLIVRRYSPALGFLLLLLRHGFLFSSLNISETAGLRPFSCLLTKSCLTLPNPMDCSTPGFPALHHLPELAQTHVHWVGDAIQPSRHLSFPSPPAFNLSQHQNLF